MPVETGHSARLVAVGKAASGNCLAVFLQYAQIFAIGEQCAQAVGINLSPVGMAGFGGDKAYEQGDAHQGLPLPGQAFLQGWLTAEQLQPDLLLEQDQIEAVSGQLAQIG